MPEKLNIFNRAFRAKGTQKNEKNMDRSSFDFYDVKYVGTGDFYGGTQFSITFNGKRVK